MAHPLQLRCGIERRQPWPILVFNLGARKMHTRLDQLVQRNLGHLRAGCGCLAGAVAFATLATTHCVHRASRCTVCTHDTIENAHDTLVYKHGTARHRAALPNITGAGQHAERMGAIALRFVHLLIIDLRAFFGGRSRDRCRWTCENLGGCTVHAIDRAACLSRRGIRSRISLLADATAQRRQLMHGGV